MGNDAINGGDGDDVIDGNAGDDTITASRGNDMITGGAGSDTPIYAGNKSDYTFNVDDYGTLTIANIDPSLGTDSILEVETLSFDDGDLSVTSTFDGSVTLTGSSADDFVTIQSNNYISGLSAEYFTNTGSQVTSTAARYTAHALTRRLILKVTGWSIAIRVRKYQ